jgi:hypothetical protein
LLSSITSRAFLDVSIATSVGQVAYVTAAHQYLSLQRIEQYSNQRPCERARVASQPRIAAERFIIATRAIAARCPDAGKHSTVRDVSLSRHWKHGNLRRAVRIARLCRCEMLRICNARPRTG